MIDSPWQHLYATADAGVRMGRYIALYMAEIAAEAQGARRQRSASPYSGSNYSSEEAVAAQDAGRIPRGQSRRLPAVCRQLDFRSF